MVGVLIDFASVGDCCGREVLVEVMRVQRVLGPFFVSIAFLEICCSRGVGNERLEIGNEGNVGRSSRCSRKRTERYYAALSCYDHKCKLKG